MKLRYVFVSLLWRGRGGSRQRNRDIQRTSRDRETENDTLLPPRVFFATKSFDLQTQTASLCLN